MHHKAGRRAVVLAALATLVGLPAFPEDYHVDCSGGDDTHDGRSPAAAWRSLAKVSATTFSPGDSILLKRGTRCTGTLWPKGSGESGKPIRLAAYGEGPLPVVDAAGGEAAVKLFNQEYWQIETIEATGGNPYGIHISGNRGTLRHFRVKNVVVHDVGGEVKAKTSGLLMVAAGGGGQTFEDVVIDGVTAYATTQWAGILVHGAAWEDKDAPGSLRERIGVFLRCTGQDDPGKALAAVRSLGLDRVQVSRLPDRFYTPEGAREFAGLLKGAGVRADAVVVVFDGESYADQDSVMRTVGLRPAALRPARMDYAKRCIDFAEAIGTTIVTFHMGFLPRDPKDPVYGEMLEALGSLAAYAAPKGVTLSLETGQETGEELVRFLDAITVARVGVNFDTANLVLYGLDDPPRALERLRGRVTSLHVKDGLPPDDPRLLGREVPLGEGRARVRECLRLLEAAGFQGPLIIENYVWRERGTDPLEELARARDFILGHDRPDARAAEPGPDALRVLVVTGGHDYPTSFYTVFEGRPEWVWSHAPSSEEAFAKEIVSRYDVLVLYDFSQQLGEEGKAHLKAFAEAAKGIVVLHHAICDYQDWPWFEELVGGRYLESDQGGWKASTYRHDVELFVRPVGSHPIVNPVGPLRLVDETYKGMRISPKVTPILEIDHPDGDRYVGWVSPYERSRVVYLQLGHDERAHRSQAYRDLVRNAILWSAGR